MKEDPHVHIRGQDPGHLSREAQGQDQDHQDVIGKESVMLMSHQPELL